MLPYKSNRTGKICHDGASEKQNFNDTILKWLCVLSACHLRSAFVQSTDCPCLCQVLFSKTERLNLLNTKDIYIKKFFHLTVNYRPASNFQNLSEKKKLEHSRIVTLGCKRNFMLQVSKIKLFSIHAETFRILALRQFQNCLRRKNVWLFRRFSIMMTYQPSNLR